MSNFTKGTWTAVYSKKLCVWSVKLESITLGTGIINEEGLPPFYPPSTSVNSEQRANAHLISAAPKMYAALREVALRMQFEDVSTDDEMKEIITNAIKKADGKQ